MENREGQRVPDVTFRTRQDNQWKDVSSRDLFAGKRVVVFCLPGAFTSCDRALTARPRRPGRLRSRH
jgi:peroxiredoxin